MAPLKGARSTDNAHDSISVPVLTLSDAEPRRDLIAIGADRRADGMQSQGLPLRVRNRSQDSEKRLSCGPPLGLPPRSSSFSSATHSDVSASGEIIIGMALGGPSTAHLMHVDHGEPSRYFSPDDVSAFSMSSTNVSQAASSADHSLPFKPAETAAAVARSRYPPKGRWKKFFRKNSTVSLSSLPSDEDQPGSPFTISFSKRPSMDRRSKPKKAKAKTLAPPLTRSQTTPAKRSPLIPAPPPKDVWMLQKLDMLQVEIPDVTMERYSIMFGKVLGQPRQPSVMFHRQAATVDLVPVRETETVASNASTRSSGHTRSQTLPPLVKPSFSLFPRTPGTRPRQRQPLRNDNVGLPRKNDLPSPVLGPSLLDFDEKPPPPPPKDLQPGPCPYGMAAGAQSPSTASSSSGDGGAWSSDGAHESENSPVEADMAFPPRRFGHGGSRRGNEAVTRPTTATTNGSKTMSHLSYARRTAIMKEVHPAFRTRDNSSNSSAASRLPLARTSSVTSPGERTMPVLPTSALAMKSSPNLLRLQPIAQNEVGVARSVSTRQEAVVEVVPKTVSRPTAIVMDVQASDAEMGKTRGHVRMQSENAVVEEI